MEAEQTPQHDPSQEEIERIAEAVLREWLLDTTVVVDASDWDVLAGRVTGRAPAVRDPRTLIVSALGRMKDRGGEDAERAQLATLRLARADAREATVGAIARLRAMAQAGPRG